MVKYALAMSVTAMMLFLACGVKGNSDVLLVFAATSLTDAMGDINEKFETNGGVDVLFSFGGSQSLAKQIASGAPADLYISAGARPVEFLHDEGIPLAESINLLTNRLVVVSRKTVARPESLAALAGNRFNRIAIADPGMAPAGAYAREALVVLGLWDALEAKLTYGSDVRATLTYVETGNADAAVVYATDARSTDLVISDVVPHEIYLSIVYPAVILDESSNKHLARNFLDFLRSGVANEIFIKHGFGMIDR
ncbi:molybdate ABC transporter substrate-binding protein [Dehalococcoidia bacterium]|nr:molybdate ABC transporter substrate-binding protein [Dehalococcoidia bacterium]